MRKTDLAALALCASLCLPAAALAQPEAAPVKEAVEKALARPDRPAPGIGKDRPHMPEKGKLLEGKKEFRPDGKKDFKPEGKDFSKDFKPGRKNFKPEGKEFNPEGKNFRPEVKDLKGNAPKTDLLPPKN